MERGGREESKNEIEIKEDRQVMVEYERNNETEEHKQWKNMEAVWK